MTSTNASFQWPLLMTSVIYLFQWLLSVTSTNDLCHWSLPMTPVSDLYLWPLSVTSSNDLYKWPLLVTPVNDLYLWPLSMTSTNALRQWPVLMPCAIDLCSLYRRRWSRFRVSCERSDVSWRRCMAVTTSTCATWRPCTMVPWNLPCMFPSVLSWLRV